MPARMLAALLGRRRNNPPPPPRRPGDDSLCSLVAYPTGRATMQIIPAPPRRQWMDDTDRGFANRCLPMLMASQSGWFMLNDRKIEVLWNGGTQLHDLHIHYSKTKCAEAIDPEQLLAISHFGHGILTWRIPYLFQTSPGWNLYVRGPANWCRDGACPLDGVVETDWSSATFTMNWKITRPDTWIAFDEGEPICQVFPVARGDLERFEPEILPLAENPQLERKYKAWLRSRTAFNAALHNGQAGDVWQKHYVHGRSIDGQTFPQHQTKLALRKFCDRRGKPAPGAEPRSTSTSRQRGEAPRASGPPTPAVPPQHEPLHVGDPIGAQLQQFPGSHGAAERLGEEPTGTSGIGRLSRSASATEARAPSPAAVTVPRPRAHLQVGGAATSPAEPSRPLPAYADGLSRASRGELRGEPRLARPSKTAATNFRIVVSSENSSYIAWQTQLFCFSALTRLGKRPTVIVHRTSGPLRPEFQIMRSWGCRVIDAPGYAIHPKGPYPPRNELGSLLTIASHPDFKAGHILFCEPDMLFVKRPQYSGELAGEYYAYLDYNQERVRTAAQKFDLGGKLNDLNRTSKIGVPYLIPAAILPRLAQRWMDILDAFEELDWIDIMYAFGIALAYEGLDAQITHMIDHNHDPLKPSAGSMIHYCYENSHWDKHWFQTGQSPLEPLTPMPSRKGLAGTINGEILKQLQEARKFNRLPRLSNQLWHLFGQISE